MRTRCPVCSTIFRVTSEQLRLKAGKVRCGQCQAIFNAFDEFLADVPAVEAVLSVPKTDAPELPSESFSEPAPWISESPESIDAPAVASTPVIWELEAEEPLASELPDQITSPVGQALPVEMPLPAEISPQSPPETLPAVTDDSGPAVELPTKLLETPEESALAAREAGLVAARELSDAPGYNRWAAGTLAGSGLGGFEGDTPHRAVWPFVLVSALLSIVLLGQLLYYFRTEVVLRLPSSAALFQLAAVDVPLPHNSELVAIETSDLQSDNARGLFVLQATLRNRASYAQAWPALELTLTDTNDTVVSRRVLMPPEYLPSATDRAVFPADGEIAVKLWIAAKDIGAAGYRLYVFYP